MISIWAGGEAASISAYRSPAEFGIGSGDVFAAAFAYFWGHEGRKPCHAADLASRAMSHYVGTRDERLAPDEFLNSTLEPAVVRPGRVYLAGPFFNMAQVWLVKEARAHLRSFGLEVFDDIYLAVGLVAAIQQFLHNLSKGPGH